MVCACVGGERMSTHSNSNSLDEDTGICLHNHSGGENTNCHVTQDNMYTTSLTLRLQVPQEPAAKRPCVLAECTSQCYA